MPKLKRRHSSNVSEIFHHIVREKAELKVGRQPSASIRSLRTFGKPFLDTFATKKLANNLRVTLKYHGHESPVGIDVEFYHDRMGHRFYGTLKIGFQPQVLVIEAIQGAINSETQLKELNRKLEKPWPNYLLGVAENHARTQGMKQVKIRLPQTNYWFHHPKKYDSQTEEWHPVTDPVEVHQIQQRLIQFYAIIAKKMHYRKEGDFYVKEL